MPPRLQLTPGTQPYLFAQYVLEGYSYQDAANEVGISDETARQWRLRLRKRCAIRLPNGRLVSYERALREVSPPICPLEASQKAA